MTEKTALALIEQKLPPMWAALWTGRETPRSFRLNAWTKPRRYFRGAEDLERTVPGLAGLCPLIERNGEAIMGWLPDGRFVELYYEDAPNGDAAIALLGRTYHEFVLSLLLEFEDAGLRDEWMELAADLRFSYTADLIAALDSEDALSALRERLASS